MVLKVADFGRKTLQRLLNAWCGTWSISGNQVSSRQSRDGLQDFTQEELNHQIQQSTQVMKMANNLVRSVAMSTLGGGTLLLVVGGGSLVSCRRAAPLPELNTLGDKCLMKRIFFLSP